MRISISDDFSLQKIADSGQCFRVRSFTTEDFAAGDFTAKKMVKPNLNFQLYRFIFRNHVLYIRECGLPASEYDVSCTQEQWDNIWVPYFDLNTDYAAIRAAIPAEDIYLRSAAGAAKGIRILQQDPWEMLITFIISQRKSIPAIKGNIEQIAAAFGTLIHTDYEDVYLFPTAEQMLEKGMDMHSILSDCRLGYRLPYVEDAVHRVFTGQLDLAAISGLSDQELFEKLKTVKGVGDKVANCVCLFGYHRTALAPVDVWIKRVIDEHYGGRNPFPEYGCNAGIMQQFLFYYIRQ